MSIPTITPIPTPPTRAEAQDVFTAKADATLASFPTFVSETNAIGEFFQDLGNAAAVGAYQGDWDSGTTYDKGDTVSYLGQFWGSKVNSNLNNAPAENANWILIPVVDFATWPQVRLATTANVTLSGEQTIDGVLTANSRVLVWNQSTASQNGLYVTGSGAWVRATDADVAAEFVRERRVTVQQGTLYTGAVFGLTSAVTTLGTDAVTFARVEAGDISFADSTGRITETDVQAAIKRVNSWPIVSLSGTTALLVTHHGKEIRATGNLTLNTLTAASAGDGFRVRIKTDSTFLTTLDSIGTVNGLDTSVAATRLKIAGGGKGELSSNGSVYSWAWFKDATERVDVASAATLDLRQDVTGSDSVNITGTTTVTAVTMRNGETIDAVAAGALPITAGASLLVLGIPSGTTFTCAAGDRIRFIGGPSSVVTALITRASGEPVYGTGPHVIAAGNINTAGDTSITLPAGTWKKLRLVVSGLKANTDYAPYIRLNADTAGNYTYGGIVQENSTTATRSISGATGLAVFESQVLIDNSATTNNSYDFDFEVANANATTDRKGLFAISKNAVRRAAQADNTLYILNEFIGRWANTSAVSSIQLLLRSATGSSPTGSTVNATAGTYYVTAEAGTP